jgi:hypothetical protein
MISAIFRIKSLVVVAQKQIVSRSAGSKCVQTKLRKYSGSPLCKLLFVISSTAGSRTRRNSHIPEQFYPINCGEEFWVWLEPSQGESRYSRFQDCVRRFVFILRRRKTDLTDRYFIVNPSVRRRPGGIFLDERLHLSTTKY